MSEPIYTLRHASAEDATAFATTVLALRQSLGREPTKEDVLATATPTTSPIHHLFTWDDSAAAERWRLEEAKYHLRTIRIRVTSEDGAVTERRLFIALVKDDEQNEPHEYVSRERVMSDQDFRSRAVRKALGELEEWQERYHELSEDFPMVFKAINETIERMVL